MHVICFEEKEDELYVIRFQTCYSAGFFCKHSKLVVWEFSWLPESVLLNFFRFFFVAILLIKKQQQLQNLQDKWQKKCAHICVWSAFMHVQNTCKTKKKKKFEYTRNHEAEAIECPSINVNNILNRLENIECVQ